MMAALVSTDVANCLAESTSYPWLDSPTLGNLSKDTILPTFQHQRHVAYKSQPINVDMNHQSGCHCLQTASLLPLGYGRDLNSRAAVADPLYALSDIFRFVASSESALINLLEYHVDRETSQGALEVHQLSLSNLVFAKRILESHMRYLRGLLTCLQSRADSRWPQISGDDPQAAKVKSTIDKLVVDFDHLLHAAEALVVRCNNGMGVIMNQAMLAESKQAISQGHRVARLTFIAFFYIPLGFTTSLFGMYPFDSQDSESSMLTSVPRHECARIS